MENLTGKGKHEVKVGSHPHTNMGNDLNRYFTKDMQMDNEYMERCST